MYNAFVLKGIRVEEHSKLKSTPFPSSFNINMVERNFIFKLYQNYVRNRSHNRGQIRNRNLNRNRNRVKMARFRNTGYYICVCGKTYKCKLNLEVEI
jgi:hypothetical protein